MDITMFFNEKGMGIFSQKRLRHTVDPSLLKPVGKFYTTAFVSISSGMGDSDSEGDRQQRAKPSSKKKKSSFVPALPPDTDSTPPPPPDAPPPEAPPPDAPPPPPEEPPPPPDGTYCDSSIVFGG